MRYAVYGALALSLLGSWLLLRLAPRIAPKAAAVLLAVGSVACAFCWVLGLSALAVVTLGRWDVVAEAGTWSAQSLRADSPVPVAVGAFAVVLLAASLGGLVLAGVRTVSSLLKLRRLRAAAWSPDNGWYVIVPSPVPEAVTVPGFPGAVLITSGMWDALSENERAVLLAHERCHLDARHWIFQVLTRLAAVTLPLGGRLVASGDQALERWADEAAGSVVGDRRLVAQTVAKAALATTAQRGRRLAVGMADGVVVARVEGLVDERFDLLSREPAGERCGDDPNRVLRSHCRSPRRPFDLRRHDEVKDAGATSDVGSGVELHGGKPHSGAGAPFHGAQARPHRTTPSRPPYVQPRRARNADSQCQTAARTLRPAPPRQSERRCEGGWHLPRRQRHAHQGWRSVPRPAHCGR